MSGLAWSRFAAALPIVALAVGGLTAPALAGPTGAATPASDIAAGPLANPAAPDVDPTKLVALTRPGVSDRQVQSQLKEGSGSLAASVAPSAAAASEGAGSVVTVSTTAAGAASTIQAMRASGLYQSVDYDVSRTVLGYTSDPNDPYFQDPYQTTQGAWGLKAYPGANFQSVWPQLATVTDGPDAATVAVIDSGLQENPDLVGSNVNGAFNYLNGTTDVMVPDCVASPYDSSKCQDPAAGPEGFHGTAVAGVIGAATNNGVGVAGAAWDNHVIVYRVGRADGKLDGAAINAALQDAITRGVRVINCSYGGLSQDQNEASLLQEARQRGILVVAAAGNEAQKGNPIEYPAGYPTVMGVGATQAVGGQAVRADFSNYGADVAISAPGNQITVLADGGYAIAGGTSFAAPMVAAAAALIWRSYPALTVDQVQSVLQSGAHDLTALPATVGWDQYTGWGQLDVPASLALAAQEIPPSDPSSPVAETPGSTSPPPAATPPATGGATTSPDPGEGVTLGTGKSGAGRPYVTVTPPPGTLFNGVLTVAWGTGAAASRSVPVAGGGATVALPYLKPGSYQAWVSYTDAASGRVTALGAKAVTVGKYKPVVKVKATRSKVTVTVRAAGLAAGRATGRVVVKLGGHKKTIRLVARDRGKTTVARTELSVKAGTVKATYKGSAWFRSATGTVNAKRT
ncbi:MAG: S8 family serine peptidase [Bifidobacteriaceae bacterium]|jgi:hypothetical protein|nr:S8 family serine peptidase [Bifidobacteriaceae bacterium]